MAGRLENPVIVTGFTQLERDLKATGPALIKQMQTGLRLAVEPIKKDAEALALSQISGMRRARKTQRRPRGFIGPLRPAWAIQKIGQNSKEVYMVPKEKGARARRYAPLRRPNFSTLMLGKAYDPALEANRVQVTNTVDRLVNTVTREF